MKVLYLGSNEIKSSGKFLNKIQAIAEEKQKINTLKIKLRKCYYVKGPVEMEPVEMEY